MSHEDAALKRALGALAAAAGDEPGGVQHPGMDRLEASVEGRLAPEAQAEIERIAARSALVAEDLADLRSVHDALTAPVGRRNVRWARVAVAAGIAASVVMGVWLANRPAAGPGPASEPVAARLTPDEQRRVDAAVAAGRIELSARAAALVRREGTLLGTPGATAALEPLGPVATAVRSSRPTFTWTDAGAEAYTVAVFDEAFAEVVRSPRVTGRSWTPEIEFPPSRTYVWQVTAHRAAGDEIAPRPPRPEARFSVLSEAARARVQGYETRLADDPLALGVLLAQDDLLADARLALERAAARADSAAAARRLLASLDAR